MLYYTNVVQSEQIRMFKGRIPPIGREVTKCLDLDRHSCDLYYTKCRRAGARVLDGVAPVRPDRLQILYIIVYDIYIYIYRERERDR